MKDQLAVKTESRRRLLAFIEWAEAGTKADFARLANTSPANVTHWTHEALELVHVPSQKTLATALRFVAKHRPKIEDPVAAANYLRVRGPRPSWLELDDANDPRRQAPQAAAPVVRRQTQAFDGTAALSLAVAPPVTTSYAVAGAYRRSIEEFVRAGSPEKARVLMAELFGPILGPEIVANLDDNNFFSVTANGSMPLAKLVPLIVAVTEEHYRKGA